MTEVPITFVSSHAQLGGSEIYLLRLLDELGPAWIRDVVCLQEGPLVDRLRATGRPTKVISVGASPPALVGGGLRLRSYLRRAPGGLVHANGIKAGVVSALASKRFVWAKHDFSWDGWVARSVARRARAVVASSRAVAAAVEGVASVDVVHPGLTVPVVDRAGAATRLREELGLPPSTSIVVQVGRLHPAKGQLELVRAAAEVLADRSATAVVLAGEFDPSTADYGARVRAEIGRLDLGDRVNLLGRREDALGILAGSDVCVIPTTRDERGMGDEGFGIVATESMAVGTPVVAFRSGALPEVLGDCGVLVDGDDTHALAAAIARVLDDDDLARRLGSCGIERVTREFSAAAMASGMRTIYERCSA